MALYYGFLHIAVLLIKHGAILDPNEMYNSESLRNRKKKNMPAIDHDGNSPLDLLSLNLKEDIIYNPTCGAKKSFGGDLYTFGKSDYQLGVNNFFISFHFFSLLILIEFLYSMLLV